MRPHVVVVQETKQENRLPLYRMLELYQHDLSNIWDQDLDIHGEYGDSLDRFWRNTDCQPTSKLAALVKSFLLRARRYFFTSPGEQQRRERKVEL